MSRYWGAVMVDKNGISVRKPLAGFTEYVLTSNVPDWVKAKIAMLDLMGDNCELPCGSKKLTLQFMNPPQRYYIVEDEDERST